MAEQPNILLIMCDQLNAGVLGCYGGPVSTPNIDHLARAGALLENAVCPFPVCSPSRASMITGVYPHTHGIVHNVNVRDYPRIPAPATEEGIKAGDVTTERLLHEAGYRTAHVGKWHLTDDDLPYYPQMFREHLEYADVMAGVFQQVQQSPREQWLDWYGWALPVDVSPPFMAARDAWRDRAQRWPLSGISEFLLKMGRLALPREQVFDVMVADRIIDTLKALPRRPFMVTCSFNLPHDPNVVPSPYYEMYPPDEISLPANHGHLEPHFEDDHSRQVVRDLGEVAVREFMRIYYGSVRLIDDQVGRILEALDDTGKAEHTVVIFTADHGDMVGEHGMVWKSTQAFYDGVARIPLLIRFPGRIAPGRYGFAANLVDFMPTLLDFAGQPIPGHVQGRSLAPYLLGENNLDDAPAYAFSERLPPNDAHTRTVVPETPGAFMVRGKAWKYCCYPDGAECLYDLADDPGETRNRAGEPQYQEQKRALRRELDAWLSATGDPARLPGAG